MDIRLLIVSPSILWAGHVWAHRHDYAGKMVRKSSGSCGRGFANLGYPASEILLAAPAVIVIEALRLAGPMDLCRYLSISYFFANYGGLITNRSCSDTTDPTTYAIRTSGSTLDAS